MIDKTKNRGGGAGSRPPSSRGPRRGPPGEGRGERPGREGSGDRPFRARREDSERGERPARPRREEGERGSRPFRPRGEDGGDRPVRARREEGDRGERPFRQRRDDAPRGDRGDRPFRPRRDEGERSERPYRPRGEDGGDRPFRARREEGDRGERPFRPRRDDAPRGDRGERPFRARRDEGERGERPFRPRREDTGRMPPRLGAARPRKEYSERVAKVIARAGLCSRRDAEAWIEEGRVAVNGEVLQSPARDVTKSDTVTVDGTPIPTRERTRLFLYHKPRGLVTTARDPEGRPTVFESLPPGLPRVVTVGRLDINTEGLLLLTNDGGLSRTLELPETGWLRRYRVRAFGDVSQADLDALRDGITIDGMHYGPVEAEIDREKGDNVWLTLGLREGKNREVKRILEHLGLQVNRLIRISFGPFQLGDLPEGAAEEVTTRILADQLGPELAEKAGADFEAPVFVYEEDDFRPRKREREERGDDRREARGRDRDERGPRGRFDDRERGGREGGREDRWSRGREETEEKPRPQRRHPTEIKRSVWRAGEEEDEAPRSRAPRRGADPKAARAESAERAHVRSGKVQSRTGRAVLVERIKPTREEEPEREDRFERPRPSRDDRGDRAERPRRSFGSQDRRDGDRPQRRFGERPEGRGPGRSGGGGKPFRSREDGNAAGDRAERPARPARPRPAGADRWRDVEAGGEARPSRPRTGPERAPGGKPAFGKGPGGGGRPFRGKPGGGGGPRSGPGGGGSRPPRRPRRED